MIKRAGVVDLLLTKRMISVGGLSSRFLIEINELKIINTDKQSRE
jgi:hypothetical protein